MTANDHTDDSSTQSGGGTERQPGDGESYDKSGDIRPVPPGVPNRPDGRGEQATLSRNPDKRQVAQLVRDQYKPFCPDCGSYVGHSKGGGKALPGIHPECFGWECRDCNLTFPSNCDGRDAPGFNSSMAGLKVEFRDGEVRWVPVPERYVQPGTDRSGGGDQA